MRSADAFPGIRHVDNSLRSSILKTDQDFQRDCLEGWIRIMTGLSFKDNLKGAGSFDQPDKNLRMAANVYFQVLFIQMLGLKVGDLTYRLGAGDGVRAISS